MLLFFLLGLVLISESAKVLFSPSTLTPVHSYTMGHLANELANRGHQVTWLEYGPVQKYCDYSKITSIFGCSSAGTPMDFQSKTILHKSVTRIFLPAHFDNYHLADLYFHKNHSIHELLWEDDFHWPNEQTTGWIAGTRLCDKMLQRHKKTFNQLVQEHFDTVIVDDLYNPCGLLLAGLKHSVFIYWSMTGLRPESAWANQSPHPPSYLPTPGTKLTEDLNLVERSYNMVAYLRELYVHQHVVHNRINAVFQKHYPGVASAFDLERNASLNFVNTPPIYDFARPFMPRVNFVGGLHCRNATQLPSELERFVQGADDEHGFVVISSGNTAQWEYSPISIRDSFINAMKAHPKTRFIWQNNGGHVEDIPNLFIDNWLPLQDLLGHKKCKAHISHGGLNSLIESVWHGVPVIGFPLTLRGYDNLLRLTHRGVGLMVTKYNLTSESLTNALTEIRKEKYKEEMLVFQDMVRDVPYTELNHAAFWVEFIERHHEIPHARSGADKLNVLQYFLVDVIGFMISILAISIAIFVVVLKAIFRLILATFRLIFGSKTQKPIVVTKAKKRN